MAWTRPVERTREKKSGRALNRFARLRQPDLLMDWMQGVSEREESKMVLWFWPPQVSHMKFSTALA